ANGCHVLPAPIDYEGLDLEQARVRFATPRMVCVSPAREYPLGTTLSPARRSALIDFSYRTGAWIVEDDYDAENQYQGQPLPALQSLDTAQRVIYMGTFSKTLLPSFRLGFLVVPPDIAEDFAKARAVIDRHAPIMEQMVLAEFMHRGLYAAHLRRMRALYRERQEAMLSVLHDHVGYQPPAYECQGGMHFVVPLRDAVSDEEVVRTLWSRQVIARPLSIYYGGRSKQSGVLLGFAAYPVEVIQEAGERLDCLRGLLPEGRSPR
ncbi:MAG TPA: PLP-dependent aminotransferase family protein, partial [Kiloniellaceae bacterium]|nr:PLP-dependent aminotransferase family protein [Kiloniellaceae bacterium]